MTLKTEILAELEHLLTLGARLISLQEGHYDVPKPENDFRAFAVGAIACIRRVAGEESDYFEMIEFPDQGFFIGGNELAIASLVGSLQALQRAVAFDLLGSLESRLRANIHDDFLEQAKVLVEAGYHVAGMVLIGGVLEDHLRKLCDSRGLICKGKRGLSQYNDLLKNEYPQPVWRQIQVVADLRNDAAHGEGDKVDAKHVEDAHAFVGRTIANYPA
jgi:hypothetical protein